MISLPSTPPKILVIGDLIIDHYLWGSCERVSPEAPVPIININNESIILGGAGNVVNNLCALGAKVDFISVIGNNEESKQAISLLENINVSTQYIVTQKDRTTSKKNRVISAQQHVLRFDLETTSEINKKSQEKIIDLYNKIIKNYDIVLLSDYGKGIFTYDLTQSLISVANKNGKKILVDPKGFDFSKYKNSFLLTPNKKEASEASQIQIKDHNSLSSVLTRIKIQCNLTYSIITLSEEGIAVFDESLRIHPTVAKEIFDVTGAGDTVLAALGFALSYNNDIDDAIRFSNLASGVVVSKIGSATASINEIIEYESQINKSINDVHIKSQKEIISIVKDLKSKNKKIVFTNGCFDILHMGHVQYLEKTKSFGDILILGLNSDKSVRKLKGSERPINSESDRAYIVASLEVIDYVVIFDEDTPLNLIKIIEPDILVKGADYQNKKVVGHDIAKKVEFVKFVEGKSTTNIIERIRDL